MKNAKRMVGLCSTCMLLFISLILFSSCATIVGGSRYNAHIVVNNSAKVKIKYMGEVREGSAAVFKVKRNEADKFIFTVAQEGCEEQKYVYTSRTFRGGAFVGSLFGFSLVVSGLPVPIPVGCFVDLATGAVWKPSVMEAGVSKKNYKNFQYVVNYNECKTEVKDISTFVDIVYLKNGSIIRGTITEMIPSEQIKIQTKDGSLFVFKFDEIEKFTKEQVN